MLKTLFTLTSLAAAASAATTVVNVGQNGFTYSPNSVTASMGDIIEFHFFPPNHSVIMGDFNNACAPATTGGFFSGFMSGASSNNVYNPPPSNSGYRRRQQADGGSQVFQVTVNSTDPIFFYCGVPTHCQAGMVGVINPSSGQTLGAYMSKASAAPNTVIPNNVFGGKSVPASGGSAPSSTPTPSGGSGSSGPSLSNVATLGVSIVGVLIARLLVA